MKRIKLRITGIFFIALGLLFMATSSFVLTGSAVLGNPQNETQSFFGVLFLIAGLVFFILSRESGNALEQLARDPLEKIKEAYENNGMGTSKSLKRMIKKAGYQLIEGKKHIKVYSGEKPVIGQEGQQVTIPRGKMAKPTYRGILEDIIKYKKK